MTIATGDKIPAITLKKLGPGGMEDINIAEYLKGKKVILFAVPGAYTPTCDQKHLPGYIKNADGLKKEGIDEIICLSVNDPFVMQAWGNSVGVEGKVTMMPDGNGELTKALGLGFDGSGHGLGALRSKRYSMRIDNGTITSLRVEESPGNLDVSAAETCLIDLSRAA